MSDMEIFLTVDETADLLKTNRRQIMRMITAGKLKAKDIGLGNGERKRYRILKKNAVKIKNGSK